MKMLQMRIVTAWRCYKHRREITVTSTPLKRDGHWTEAIFFVSTTQEGTETVESTHFARYNRSRVKANDQYV